MNDLLSSVETEYGFAALDPKGERLNPQLASTLFNTALQGQQPWLPATEGGYFLGNGARVYWDAGNHPEYAAPECAGHPRHLLAHVRAGHAIVSRVARQMERNSGVGKVIIWRANVDYLNRQTWGCHENYMTRQPAENLTNEILPHLVSRVIYGGAGGWSPGHRSRYSLSPRLELFQARVSLNTTFDRGIINTRNQPHATGSYRLHLICRDSLTSQLADLLSIGMTRLVVSLADQNLRPARWLSLDNELAAMHTFCLDTTCRKKVSVARGRLSAIDIQRRYIEQIGRNSDKLPEWSHEIADLCTSVLDGLAENPRDLYGKLDWPTKLAIFESESGKDPRELQMQDVLLSDLQHSLLGELYQRSGSEIVSAREIESAIVNAPSTTRASVRGNAVKQLSGRHDSSCDWTEVYTPRRRLVLNEPFATNVKWQNQATTRE